MPMFYPHKQKRLEKYIESLQRDTVIHASEVSKQFNYGRSQKASMELKQLPDVKKIGKGVFVKL